MKSTFVETRMGRIPCIVTGQAARGLHTGQRIRTKEFLAIEAFLSDNVSYKRSNEMLNLMTRRSRSAGSIVSVDAQYSDSIMLGLKTKKDFQRVCTDILSGCGIGLNDIGEVIDHSAILPVTKKTGAETTSFVPASGYSDEPSSREREIRDYVSRYNENRPQTDRIKEKAAFEDPGKTVYCSVDDVLVHMQKRKTVRKNGRECIKTKGSWIYHSVASIEVADAVSKDTAGNEDRVYILEADTQRLAYSYIMAFLLYNDLTDRFIVFFSDGEETLKTIPEEMFSEWPHVFYMDYYHLKERITELFSKVFRAGKIADDTVEPQYFKNGKIKKGSVKMVTRSVYYTSVIISMLWAGNVNDAIDWLESMKSSDELKAGGERFIDSTITYLSNKRDRFPCYALREYLGLKNSSNSVEIANNILVAKRQKKKGYSWCQSGSFACSETKAIFVNEEAENYYKNGTISFRPRHRALDSDHSQGLEWLHDKTIDMYVSQIRETVA
jgi:hypothetical protein